jgi:2-(1,2-epoxy-1,2-dihydrophenyl)acetyl-CoA isomerase
MAQDFETILYEPADGYAVVRLNRPDKLNAFNDQMHADLRAALDLAESDKDVRALVFTGAGRGFCAGQDLGDRVLREGEGPRDTGAGLEQNYNPLVLRLKGLAMPVISAINGVAAGAGCNFALAADIALAARSARFIQAFVKIGLTVDCGGSYFLPRSLGAQRAMALAMTGDPIDAEQAAAWGLVWKCVDDDALMDEARGLAARFGAMSSVALDLIKRSINASATNDIASQLALEADLQREAGRAPDYQEGIRAFLEKRPPNFHP